MSLYISVMQITLYVLIDWLTSDAYIYELGQLHFPPNWKRQTVLNRIYCDNEHPNEIVLFLLKTFMKDEISVLLWIDSNPSVLDLHLSKYWIKNIYLYRVYKNFRINLVLSEQLQIKQ